MNLFKAREVMTSLLGIHGRFGAMLRINGISYVAMSHYEPLSMSLRINRGIHLHVGGNEGR